MLEDHLRWAMPSLEDVNTAYTLHHHFRIMSMLYTHTHSPTHTKKKRGKAYGEKQNIKWSQYGIIITNDYLRPFKNFFNEPFLLRARAWVHVCVWDARDKI